MIWLALTALASPPSHIVGGELTEAGDWPSVTAVYRRGEYSCTGVLIAPSVVLTAGHCGRLLSRARPGVIDADDTSVEPLVVAEVIQYPDYLQTYDLALVLLEEPSDVPPSPLLFDCGVAALRDGVEVTAVGYGATDRFGTNIDGLQRFATMPVVDADCDNPTNGCNPSVLPGGEVIAGGDGVDSCNGDSGGPLFLTLDDVDYVAGIVSRAALPASDSCGDGGIYSRVDSVIDWIETEAGIELTPPDCSSIPQQNTAPTLTVDAPTNPVTEAVRLPLTVADADGDNVTLEVAIAPLNGTLTLQDDAVVYTPNDDVRAADAFTLRAVDDGTPSEQVEHTVSLTVDTVPVVPDEPEPEGCSCTAIPGRMGWMGGMVIALLAVRRRR